MLRDTILAASRNEKLREFVSTGPLTKGVVERFVAGEEPLDVIAAANRLTNDGLNLTVDHLGEDVLDRDAATGTKDAYLTLLKLISEHQMSSRIEVSVKLSALGQALPGDGEKIALDNAFEVVRAATQIGTTVTLDMEDHTTTDSTLGVLRELRKETPSVGAVLQSYLLRTEGDCRDLTYEGSRVRLCKGAYKEPASVAFQSKSEVDRSYVRCMRVLMMGDGYPMLATHDPRLVEIATSLALRSQRASGTFEYQMLLGIRPDEQIRLAQRGEKVRIYVPYGQDWYGYLMRRMAERPANLTFFLRSLISRG